MRRVNRIEKQRYFERHLIAKNYSEIEIDDDFKEQLFLEKFIDVIPNPLRRIIEHRLDKDDDFNPFHNTPVIKGIRRAEIEVFHGGRDEINVLSRKEYLNIVHSDKGNCWLVVLNKQQFEAGYVKERLII